MLPVTRLRKQMEGTDIEDERAWRQLTRKFMGDMLDCMSAIANQAVQATAQSTRLNILSSEEWNNVLGMSKEVAPV